MKLQSSLAFREASLLRIPPKSRMVDSPVAGPGAPPRQPTIESFAARLSLYLRSVLLSVVVTIFALHLWRADLRIPFNYTSDGNDSFINMMQTKTVIETGWNAHNPLLGAPGTLDQLDFPNPEFIHWMAIRAISIFTRDFGLAINAYFLLTFPLIALTTTLAARQIGLRKGTAILIAQLYTFLPFHFMRGEMHLSLAAYYALPLTIPAIVAVAAGIELRGLKRAIAVVGFVSTALSSPYYAAFSIFFLGAAAVIALVQRRDRNAFRTAAMLGTIALATFFAQIIPNLLHSARFGPNPMAGARVLYEGDLYGLRLTQMLLTVPGHRIPALAEFRDEFAAHAPMVNENECSALGIVGSWGLLVLLFFGIFGNRSAINLAEPGRPRPGLDALRESRRTLTVLSILLLAGVLLATVGGLGPTLNYLGFTTIRGYNRISIFLALFSLLAVGIAFDGLSIRSNRLRTAIGGLILIVGLLDQISPRFAPNYQRNAQDFNSDAKFVAAIESSVPAGAAIFQLPIMSYPECAPINNLNDYQLFRGYLHSASLRWSYGAMKGREISRWQEKLALLSLPNAIAEMQANGFSGIYLDRNGYVDDGTERSLRAILGSPIVSENGRLVFFRFASRPL
jgi:phosphoglycerol transferase